MPSTTESAKPTSVNVANAADASSSFVKNFMARTDELLAAMSGTDFYIQSLMSGVAMAVAWLLAMLIRRRIRHYLTAHPPRHIDIEFILKPLRLLAPLLAVLTLSTIKPLADRFASVVDLTGALVHLTAAYLLAKAVLVLVQSRLVAYFIAFSIMVAAALNVTGFTQSTVAYLNAISIDIGKFHITMLNLVHGVVILVVVFWIAGLLSRTLESYLRRSSKLSYTARELSVKLFKIFVYFIAFIITLSAMGVDLTVFAVFGGALGVGIGLGLQKITSNFVSGMTLLMEKSIQLGDLVEVGNITGWVRSLNVRYTLIETFDGREVMIPNEDLMVTRVTNWTLTTNKARVEVKVGVSYRSDAVKARELMLEAAREHRRCLKDPEPLCWLLEFGESNLHFTLVFWIPDVKEGRNGPQSDVMFAILDKFRKHGIEMDYPRREVRILEAT